MPLALLRWAGTCTVEAAPRPGPGVAALYGGLAVGMVGELQGTFEEHVVKAISLCIGKVSPLPTPPPIFPAGSHASRYTDR